MGLPRTHGGCPQRSRAGACSFLSHPQKLKMPYLFVYSLIHIRIRDILVPDPWIRTSDQRIRILLFSSVSFRTSNKNIFCNNFFGLLLFEGSCKSFHKDKNLKKSQNSRKKYFSYHFCLMMEGSGSGAVSLTYGSGCGRPKNFRNRNRNTVRNCKIKHFEFCDIAIVRHVTGNDKDYLRKIPRVVW